jgi:hypothetical protein
MGKNVMEAQVKILLHKTTRKTLLGGSNETATNSVTTSRSKITRSRAVKRRNVKFDLFYPNAIAS